ncbi:hypothetical protein SAMN04487970_1011118 [Paenibacillus tianmuensis]|uniref:Glyoxalase/Bleomycin resistance protein/Dioxygenase superfamily protein n=1 Tax=Paenibacillus tianmuensis TaxID=624147 RepID=A0A1G4R3B3_9BACL|nr:VOC family protein [Paenibacillus tianmuensis]SCW51370.1 hypothetical protein SAMN04487970_1011118 [Paenibacillus tianmuensis]
MRYCATLVREAFGFAPTGPIVLPNRPHAHAAIYFEDPDGNSLEFICPIELGTSPLTQMIYLEEWEKNGSPPNLF